MPEVDEPNSEVTWGCNGIGTGTSTQSDKCSATRTGPNPGICGPNNGKELSEKPTDDLCYNPDKTTSVDDNYLNGVVDLDKEEWIWTCNGSHNDFNKCPKQLSKDCKATCVPEIDATAKPNPFLLTEDGVTVEVTVEKKGDCAGAYTCTVDGNGLTNNKYVFYDLKNPKNIVVTCTSGNNVTTKTISLNGYCIEKSCGANGTCQAMPKTGVTSLKDCINTCNSNADCTSGRMIETKP
jgi:hypothetical protein